MAAENVVLTQATLGLISSWVLSRLKAAPWIPWINQHSAALNHSFLLLTSAFGALGVHLAWNASGHSLTITGLDLVAITSSLWLWAKQWTAQFLVQRGIFGPVSTATPSNVMNPFAGGIGTKPPK